MKVIYIEKDILPCGEKCQDCHKVAKPGQVVFYKSVKNVGHILWHKKCLEHAVKMAPDDLELPIDDEVANIKKQYEGTE